MSNKQKLGELGELLVQENFKHLIRSSNPYDTECDFRDSQGRTYEIKTQVRHVQKNCFTIRGDKRTNLEKCLKCDFLYFVEYNSSDIIRIWECIDRNSRIVFLTKSGLNMVGFRIDDMRLLKEIKNAELANEMRSYSNSKML